MSKTPAHTTDRVHPVIYAALIGLAALYALSAWIGFGENGHTDYLLGVMTAFIVMVIALPGAIWHTRRTHRRREHQRGKRQPTFSDWATNEFTIGKEHMTGTTAAIEILLPIAAAAFGMLAFAILTHVLG